MSRKPTRQIEHGFIPIAYLSTRVSNVHPGCMRVRCWTVNEAKIQLYIFFAIGNYPEARQVVMTKMGFSQWFEPFQRGNGIQVGKVFGCQLVCQCPQHATDGKVGT